LQTIPLLEYADGSCPGGYAVSPQEQLQFLLRQVRNEAGLTQTDIAERLGQPQSFVSKYESGERRLDILELRSVCTTIGISLADFIKRLEQSLR
jgi:predicted transcriptional regulator